jgi:hypothetical protein
LKRVAQRFALTDDDAEPTAPSPVCYRRRARAWEDARTFNNDWMGYAVKNGLRLRELLGVGR